MSEPTEVSDGGATPPKPPAPETREEIGNEAKTAQDLLREEKKANATYPNLLVALENIEKLALDEAVEIGRQLEQYILMRNKKYYLPSPNKDEKVPAKLPAKLPAELRAELRARRDKVQWDMISLWIREEEQMAAELGKEPAKALSALDRANIAWSQHKAERDRHEADVDDSTIRELIARYSDLESDLK